MAGIVGQRPDGARADQGPRAGGHRLPQPVRRPGRRPLRRPRPSYGDWCSARRRSAGPIGFVATGPAHRPAAPVIVPAGAAIDPGGRRRPDGAGVVGRRADRSPARRGRRSASSRDAVLAEDACVAWLVLSVVFLAALGPARVADPALATSRRGAVDAGPGADGRDARSASRSRGADRAGRPDRRVDPVVPVDPRAGASTGPLDPALARASGRVARAPHRAIGCWLPPHRPAGLDRASPRSLVAELVLWTVARFVPLEWAAVVGVAIPVVGAARPARRRRPRAAVARRDRPRRRRRGAARRPRLERPRARRRVPGVGRPGEPRRRRPRTRERPARRRRRDRPRSSAASARDALAALRADAARPVPAALLAAPAGGRRSSRPLLLVPGRRSSRTRRTRSSPSSAQVREAADRQAERLDELAEELEAKGERRRRPADAARPGAARPGPPAARPPGRARREPRPARRHRERRPRPDRPGERAARGVADVAQPALSQRRDRQAGREPRRRPGEGAGGPRAASADKLDDDDAAGAARTSPDSSPRSRRPRRRPTARPARRCATRPRAWPRATRPAPGPPSTGSARR